MSNRQEKLLTIESIDKEISILQDAINLLQSEKAELKKKTLLRKIQNLTWEIHAGYDYKNNLRVSLSPKWDKDFEKWKHMNYSEGWHHYSFKIDDDLSIRVDDGYIQFVPDLSPKELIQKLNLKVDEEMLLKMIDSKRKEFNQACQKIDSIVFLAEDLLKFVKKDKNK